MANFTRLRPSRIPARKNSVRRCCFTVRGLMLSWPAISLFAAALHEQVQDLLIAGRHFNLIETDHDCVPPASLSITLGLLDSTAFANCSHLCAIAAKYFGSLALGGGNQRFHVAFRGAVVR